MKILNRFRESQTLLGDNDLIAIEKCHVQAGENVIIDLKPEDPIMIKKGLTIITGSSGSGKSTLIEAIMSVDIDQEDFYRDISLKTHESIGSAANKTRLPIPFFSVLQGYSSNDFDFAYTEQNPEFDGSQRFIDSVRQRKLILKGENVDAEQILELAEKINIREILEKDISPHRLSGGEKQRLAILGALALEPKVIFADEPTASVDPSLKEQIFQTYRDLCDENTDLGIVVVTHAVELAEKYADERIHITSKAQTVTVS